MTVTARPILLPVILAILILAGCAWSGKASEPRLDEETGVTLSRADMPVVLYRDASARAAHARDFVYLGPVQVNRMGSLRSYLWFGVWSALPATDPAAQRDSFEDITLFADGEPMQLSIAGWSPSAIGASRDVYVKPVASAADAYYEVTIDQIRLIAASQDLRILTSGPDRRTYELWNRQASAFDALNRFVQQTDY